MICCGTTGCSGALFLKVGFDFEWMGWEFKKSEHLVFADAKVMLPDSFR